MPQNFGMLAKMEIPRVSCNGGNHLRATEAESPRHCTALRLRIGFVSRGDPGSVSDDSQSDSRGEYRNQRLRSTSALVDAMPIERLCQFPPVRRVGRELIHSAVGVGCQLARLLPACALIESV